jgi:Condensation domain
VNTEDNTTLTAFEAINALGDAQYEFPTTIAQQALWYLDRLHPGDPAWNIAVRFRLRGPLDISILQRALNEVVRRHEILRTTFLFDGDAPVQIVHASCKLFLPVDDLSALFSLDRDAEEERRTVAEAARPFDLKTGPLFRARLLRLAARDYMLLVTVHHIVSDGWSIGIISDEIAAHYEAFASNKPSSSPELTLQYADYSIWQKQRAQNNELELHRSYWRTKLADLPLCEIKPDFPRPPLKTNNGYILSVLLPTRLTDSLTEFSHRHNCTLYITSLAVLKVLIAYYTQQNDIYVGTLVAGRDRVELEPLIGLFVNTLVLRADLSGDPKFTELLVHVRQTVEEALAHQDLHFQQIVEALRLKPDLSRPTLYSINFIYQRDFVKPREFSGLTMVPVPSKSPGAIYDLNFFMVQRSDGWRLSCEYNCDLYDPASVSRMLGQLRNLFEELVTDPTRRISEFSFPEDAGDPLPNLAPQPRRIGEAAQSEKI